MSRPMVAATVIVSAIAVVVLLAVLHGGIDATLRAAGAADGTLAGKPLLDCNNPVETERFTLHHHRRSGRPAAARGSALAASKPRHAPD